MAVSGMKGNSNGSLASSAISDNDLNVFCQPCCRDGSISVANGYCKNCFEHLCESCVKVHKKHKLSRDHMLLDKTNMPKFLQSSITQSDLLFKRCPKHKQEIIKFFCKNHKIILCSVCFTLEHSPKSCLVNYIPDISKDVIDGRDYHDIVTTIDKIVSRFHELKDVLNKLFIESNDSLKNVLDDIQTFRKEINQRVDELEQQVEEAANVIKQDVSERMKKVESVFNEATKSLQNSSNKIKQLNESKQADNLFVEISCAKELANNSEKQLLALNNYDFKLYTFKKNETFVSMLRKEKSLGVLLDKTLNGEIAVADFETKSRQSCYDGDICVETSKDKYPCWITGMTVITPHLIVITDWNNKAIKMVNVSSQSVTDHLILEDRPWDVTLVSRKDQLAVTLLTKQKVQFISISSNKLRVVKRALKVDGDCYGISCVQDKLVVSFQNPVKLQILDVNCTVLTTIRDDSIFGNSFYIYSNSSSIYVSDTLMKMVTKLNWQGEVISSYGSLGLPYGITHSEEGSIFVCDRERNVIEEISEDCVTGKVLLKDLKYPQAVCWCAETKLLLYSCHAGDGKHNNLIQVHRLIEA